MTKPLTLALVFLLSVAYLQAQNPPPAGNPSDHPMSAHASTVRGCLQISDSSFTLTENSGTTYEIQGDISILAEHLGHEVQITVRLQLRVRTKVSLLEARVRRQSNG